MKRTFIIALLAIASLFTIASCGTAKGGCKSTQGMVGYGGH